jgi:hypothetical protein
MKTIALGIISLLVLVVGFFLLLEIERGASKHEAIDPTPRPVTLMGTYLCLPHIVGAPATEECAFGIQTDGTFYAVNFGQSASAMEQFQRNARVRAEGFVVPKEAFSTEQWNKYDMQGIFTVTRVLEEVTQPQGKIDIIAVCEGALAYMTFETGKQLKSLSRTVRKEKTQKLSNGGSSRWESITCRRYSRDCDILKQ